MYKLLILILTFGFCSLHAFAQTGNREDTTLQVEEPTHFLIVERHCKVTVTEPIWVYDYVPVQRERVIIPPAPVVQNKVPFLQVHGNVYYNVNYYSRIDTPYQENDVYQHTIQTYLDILVKGKYPMRVYLTNRFSNSKLFPGLSDFNFSYNNTRFKQELKNEVRKKFLASLPAPTFADSLQKELDRRIKKLQLAEQWVKNPAILQKMVEERETALKQATRDKVQETKDKIQDSLQNKLDVVKDSVLNKIHKEAASIEEQYTKRKEEVDSLRRQITQLQDSLNYLRRQSKADVQRICEDIEQANNPAALQKMMQTLHIGDSVLPKGYKMLMAIRAFGLGRSVVNYSELSAKNISINGLHVEYNPSAYYALAVGKVDYRFRDFIVRNPRQSDQYLTVLRYGRGSKDKSNVILTWFTGRRQLYNAGTIDSPQVGVPSSGLMGLTIEGNYRITENITVTAEVAKSSVPYYKSDSGKSRPANQLFSMSDRTNEAYALRATAFIPQIQTRLFASLKRLGANFQSFSTFTDGAAQSAWSARLNQLFFKRQLDITLGANTNDFSNPFIGSEYRSTTVFKSMQVTLRKRNWPVISAGYFPSSQITRIKDGDYKENLFYTLTGNLTHAYRYGQLMMNTTAVYTQFYNKSSDTGFVYFNTKNLLLSQSFFFKAMTLQANASGAINQDYRLYMAEAKALYSHTSYLMLGAGIKYNYQTGYRVSQLGYSAEATIQIPHLGQVQFSADKGFIPGMNKQLVENKTGRLSYFKTF